MNYLDAILDKKAKYKAIVALKFILLNINSYIIRLDFLRQRINALEILAKVSNFIIPLKQVKLSLVNKNKEPIFTLLIASAVGAILLNLIEYINLVKALTLIEIKL